MTPSAPPRTIDAIQTLQAGTRICHYEILTPIGSGGMGEVWRARDTRLRRDVAIKTLPAALAKDAGRLARLEREAELASVNHDHIAAIESSLQTPTPVSVILNWLTSVRRQAGR